MRVILSSNELGFSTSIWKKVKWNKVGSISIWENPTSFEGNVHFERALYRPLLWPQHSLKGINQSDFHQESMQRSFLLCSIPGLAFLREWNERKGSSVWGKRKRNHLLGAGKLHIFSFFHSLFPTNSYWAVYEAWRQQKFKHKSSISR